ncbi:MAG: 16S rRNA (guanine(527)-N(7))-methyltransferase RsmG [Candidatus Limnocylindrales bacterium]
MAVVTSREGTLNRHRAPLPTRVDSLPDLPGAYDAELERAVATLGVVLTAGARAAIDGHVRLLLAWNEAINLTAIREPVAIARQHVADSLSALVLVRAGPHARIADLGSGGGFPGMPLAAALPETIVELVDSVAKKTGFLEAVAMATGLAGRVHIATMRAEALPRRQPFDVVTARAVGALAELVELALPILKPGGRLIAWKRGDLVTELAAGGRAARALGGGVPRVHEVPATTGLEGHVLVEIRRERPAPEGYPRDPASRRRQPW